MLLKILRFFKGYVCFKADGKFPERFLNLCANNGISVINPKIKDGVLYAKMTTHDYKLIRHFAFVSKIRPRITKKCGFNVMLNQYKHRTGIFVGIFVFVILLNLLTMFIWNINIEGNEKVSDEKIIEILKKNNVYEGVFRASVDAKNLKQQILIDCPDLSFAAFNIDGCFATLDVRETEQKQMEERTDYPANIVAKTGGTIISIKAYYGVPEVKIGEAVAAGDLLISGTMETTSGSVIYCNARAEVIAQTFRRLEVFVPFNQKQNIASDSTKTRRIVNIFGLNIPLFFGTIDKPYEIDRTEYCPVVNSKRLPFKIITAKITPQREQQYVIDEATAKKLAKTKLDKMRDKTLKNIVKKEQNLIYTTEKNGVRLIGEYVCNENIAKSKKIVIN